MRMFRPIPKQELKYTMSVRVPQADGTLGTPAVIIGVGFEKWSRVTDDEHRSAIAGGAVFVDAVKSRGAFEVPAGSRVAIDGQTYMVRECVPVGDLFARVHHWELELG